jgi:branched-chain amino acid transport system permease protein
LDLFLQFLVVGLMEGGVYALIGASVVLVFKATKVVSMAHGQLLTFGALFFYFFFGFFKLPVIVALTLSFIAIGMMGFLIERLTLRPLIGQPLFAAFLVTFAIFVFLDGVFLLIVKGGILSVPSFLSRESLIIENLRIPKGQLISFLLSLGVFGIIGLMFLYSKTGLGMRATAEDHQLAQSTGISVKNIFMIIWIVSSMVAAAGGITTTNVIDIYYTYPLLGFKGLIVALLGGLESLPGALIGGILLGIIENVSAGYLDPILGGGLKEVAAYFILLLILLVKPYGLFGLVRIERI